MNPTDYGRLASFEELDHEHSEHERILADTFDEGTFSEDGGTLGYSDWESARTYLLGGYEPPDPTWTWRLPRINN